MLGRSTRRGAITAAIAITGVAWVGTAPPASAHGACRYRGDRVSGLAASAGVSCAAAQRVAAAYDAKVMNGGVFPSNGTVTAGKHSCRTSSVGEEQFSVRCTSGANVVRFAWGV